MLLRLSLFLLLLIVGSACSNAEVSTQPGAEPPSTQAPATTAAPSAAGGAISVSGTVEAGVEPGCLLLKAGEQTYLLVGNDDLKPGATVTVQGTVDRSVMGFCMQGTPLRVTSVRVSAAPTATG